MRCKNVCMKFSLMYANIMIYIRRTTSRSISAMVVPLYLRP